MTTGVNNNNNKMPAVKEPINLMQDDNKRPDGTTLLPRARGKPMAWDVTVAEDNAEQDRQVGLLQIGQHTQSSTHLP